MQTAIENDDPVGKITKRLFRDKIFSFCSSPILTEPSSDESHPIKLISKNASKVFSFIVLATSFFSLPAID